MVGLGLGPRTRLGPRTNRWMSAASDERLLRLWKSWYGFLYLYIRSIAHHLEHRVQLAIRNRSHTSHCITTISCYQTRPVRSLLTPSRDTHTYRRSLPIYQSRNTLNTLKDKCLYVRKGPYPKCIRKRTTTTNHGRRTGQRS